MEASVAPEEIGWAAWRGETDVVRAWLDGGGDASAITIDEGDGWGTLLSMAVVRKTMNNEGVIALLLSRGARVDATDSDGWTALHCLLNSFDGYGSPVRLLRLLLSNGADVNLAINPRDEDSSRKCPLMRAATDASPGVVRMLLRAGADPKHCGNYSSADGRLWMAEEDARSTSYQEDPLPFNSRRCAECADLLRDVRLAGGWVRYALQPHYDLLVFRALCHRGRATFDSWTPEVLVRLFGAPEARRRNNALRGRVDLPDPLFWRVLEFSLGPVYDYPWVQQRVRARAALARGGRGSR